MVYNILNGDSLAYNFTDTKISGDLVVCREGLIDGNLFGDNLNDFWHSRATYLNVPKEEYDKHVVIEFEKILNAPNHSEFNLWFEFDLFCQVNMWFIISIINNLSIKKNVYAVYTSHLNKTNKQFWNGFGRANTNELINCFDQRILLNDIDLQFGQELWYAYKSKNHEELIRLAKNPPLNFPYLKEVIQAHVDRFPKDDTMGRPEKVIEDIIQNGITEFEEVFREFYNRESIYGFGDTQVKYLYDKLILRQFSNQN